MAFLGMRGTGNFPEGAILNDWRQMLLYLYPNGNAPLMAIMAMLESERTTSPTFEWWSKTMPVQSGVVTAVYTDSNLATVYASGAVEGDVLYLKVSAATVNHFRNGHQAEITKALDPRYSLNSKVISRLEAGDSSYIAVKLIETPVGAYPITGVNYISVIGNINPEGGTMPDSISYDPTSFSNYTQIFRTPLSITRTAMRTQIKYGTPAYQEAKREALELHGFELENAFTFGRKSSRNGANNKPERTTQGIVSALRTEYPTNFRDFRYDAAFSGQTWAQGGKAWLDKTMADLSDYGSGDRLALHGGAAGTGLRALVEAGTEMHITPQTTDYGIKVNTWVTENLTINFKKSPMYARKPTTDNMILLLEPRNLRFRYVDDTTFKEDEGALTTTRNNSKDAVEEEFLTEAGLEYHHLQSAMVLYGVGSANLV